LPTHVALSRALLRSIGIDYTSYEEFVAWALCEHLVATLAAHPDIDHGLFDRPDALKRFRSLLEVRTARKWATADYERLFERVKASIRTHARQPVTYEEYLKLLWQVPLACTACQRRPPDVTLHVDHVVPASRGGSSKRHNLQFLCAEHNLRKGNRLERGKPWLNLQ
jgi:5-methylcytosine-specific restriction endonuclease McrA